MCGAQTCGAVEAKHVAVSQAVSYLALRLGAPTAAMFVVPLNFPVAFVLSYFETPARRSIRCSIARCTSVTPPKIYGCACAPPNGAGIDDAPKMFQRAGDSAPMAPPSPMRCLGAAALPDWRTSETAQQVPRASDTAVRRARSIRPSVTSRPRLGRLGSAGRRRRRGWFQERLGSPGRGGRGVCV